MTRLAIQKTKRISEFPLSQSVVDESDSLIQKSEQKMQNFREEQVKRNVILVGFILIKKSKITI